jgi:alpha-galactosidase
MSTERAIAMQLRSKPGADGFPSALDWQGASPIVFHSDWRGENPDPNRETQVHLLWNTETLFVQFRARYRTITVFPDADPGGRREQLWERDVAEAFIQPDPAQPRRYKEFEISPNGYWIDLDIDLGTPERKRDLHSGLRREVQIMEAAQVWIADVAIPMKALVTRFNPSKVWRVNFYRVEGPQEPRFYSAWRPTGTAGPDFHLPQAFGELVFVDG